MIPFKLTVEIKPRGDTRSLVSQESFALMADANLRQLIGRLTVGPLPSISCVVADSDAATIEFEHNLPRGSFELFLKEQQEAEARGVGIEGKGGDAKCSV